MGILDGLFPAAAPQTAPTLDGILSAGQPSYAPRDDGSTLLGSILASGGLYQGPNVAYRSSVLPVSAMDDGSLRFDSAAGVAPPIASAASAAATAPYAALRDLPGLARDAYTAGGFAAPAGAVTENGAQDAQTNVAGRALVDAGSLFGPSALEARPAGSLGIFGGRAADASGAQRIAGDNRFVANLQRGADQAAQEHVLSLIPAPLSMPERAVQGTRGMSVPEIMSSEPLWGYSKSLAEQTGASHSVAFSALANHVFEAHGHSASLSPAEAKGFMQMERLRYGMDPTTD